MSEGRRVLKCLSCGAVAWQDDAAAVPAACPACASPWREPGVAILQRVGDELPDGASILREPSRLVAEVRRLHLYLAAHHVKMGLALPHTTEGPCPICAEAASPPAAQALLDD